MSVGNAPSGTTRAGRDVAAVTPVFEGGASSFVPPRPAEPRNIVLVGFMGCGKSTIGRALARLRGWRFVDTDEVIRAAAGGRDIPGLFRDEGEAAFRDRETQAILGVCAGQGQVIATGGGAVLRPENGAALRGAGLVVWLTARPEVIVARTRHRAADRPVLARGGEELLVHVLRLLGERGPRYQAVAHLIVDASDRTPIVIAREIERKVAAARPAPQGQPRPDNTCGKVAHDAR